MAAQLTDRGMSAIQYRRTEDGAHIAFRCAGSGRTPVVFVACAPFMRLRWLPYLQVEPANVPTAAPAHLKAMGAGGR